jgi:RHS repeat-associated protein
MMTRVRSYIKLIAIVNAGLIVPLSVAFSAPTKSPEGSENKIVITAMQAIEGQSQSLLPDGRLLLVGGQESGAAVKRAFFQNTQTGARTTASGELLIARAFHSATLLPNGCVLILGGINDESSVLSQAELFNPTSQTFGNYSTDGLTPRAYHTATLLTDGRVLIAGGLDGQGNTFSQIEIWDYRANQSTTLAVALKIPRRGHTATLLSDGTVLLWGGQDKNGNPLDNGEIIDPSGPSVRTISMATASSQVAPGLAASIPQNGETNIQINQLISLRFSEPLNVTSLNTGTITLRSSQGNLAIRVVPAEGGILVFITPTESLQSGTEYILSVSGAVDEAGQSLPDTSILFTTVSPDIISSSTSEGGTTNVNSTGSAEVAVTATAIGQATTNWRKMPILQAEDGVTALAGQVLTLNGSPLPNVLIEIDSQQATTDNTGRFLVRNTGSGHHMMIVDGAPASSKAVSYGLYRVGVDLKAGQTNSLNYTIWMTALDTVHVVSISSPTTRNMVITNPDIPGLELHIPAGTVIRDARGNLVTQVGITQIPTSQPPFPIKKGLKFPVYFTVQPGGATFANTGNAWSSAITGKAKGATIHYKNYMKAKAGSRFAFWNYDPTQKGWYTYGKGTVSSDAEKVVPDNATQITSFDAASMGSGNPDAAATTGPKSSNPSDGEPVDLQTGLFVYTKTDLMLNDVIPLSLTRTYRQGDYISRDFGVGMNMPYDMFLVGDSADISSPEGFTYEDLILADGGKIHFIRTSPCDSNGYCEVSNAAFTSTSTPGDFYGATIQYTGDDKYWTLTKRDGTVYQFNGFDAVFSPRMSTMLWMRDRNGNTVTFTRDGSGNLLNATSPNGRWIQFSYDSNNRIIGAQDNIGRTTSYTYNAAGSLATATDVNGGVTKYTYDQDGEMLTITDPRGIVYLQNQYDSNSLVSQQTMADGGIYQFAYTLDLNGNVTQTNVTDPGGFLRTVTFNSDGYMTSDVHAAGKPEQQSMVYNRQPGTGLVLSTTDTLNRTTAMSYDSMANVTSMTRLAGTSNAVTTEFAYNSQFSELTTITDPLGNTSVLTYDDNGNLLTLEDPLGNTNSLAYNSNGQPTMIQDAQGNQTQLTYSLGNLVSISDPLGRSVSRFVDGAGRVAAITDPLNHTTRVNYDAASEVVSTVDPLNNKTSFTYDGNGNLLTVTDANQNTTSYTYNNMDHPISRTDPLGNAASAQYDLMGNLTQVTDRKSQVTTFAYDGLNRPNHVTFADGSTIAYTLDAGSRPTTIADSASGTITRSYDLFNHLLKETTPQGSVGYTYDADGRRQTMTVSGQAQVIYTFDNASRLTAIAQGASNVSFSYDTDSRRASLTLPNGVVASYSYDAASQLTGISYQRASGSLGNLLYGYDLAGRRTSVTGSLASTQLPAAVSSAVYNANNQLTQWGSTAMTYDANGNTLNDGTNSYVWDARNRLVSADNNGASFSYDPPGRRTAKTLLSSTTGFVYDGANPVQEQSGGAATANLLTGGVDEYFLRMDTTGTYSYLTDALGSTVALTDSTGASVEQYSYGPYGILSSNGNDSNSYTYTGRESDGLGIDYYRARYYNPATGRFLSEDPSGFRSGINFYAYADSNPISFTDPTGKYFISGAVTGAIFGGLGAANSGSVGAVIGGAIGGAIAGGFAGALLPPGPLTGAAAGAAGDLAGQAIGGGNINWGEFGGSALGGAVGGGFSQYMNGLGAANGLAGSTLDWGTDIFGGGVGMVGGMLGGGEGGKGGGGNGGDGNGGGGNGGGGNGGWWPWGGGGLGRSLAARKC